MRAILLLTGIIAALLGATFWNPYLVLIASLILSIGIRIGMAACSRKWPYSFTFSKSLNYCWLVSVAMVLGGISACFNAPRFGKSIFRIPHYSSDNEYFIEADVLSKTSKATVEQYEIAVKSLQPIIPTEPISMAQAASNVGTRLIASAEQISARNVRMLLYTSPTIPLKPGETVVFRSSLRQLTDTEASKWNIAYSALVANPSMIKITGEFFTPSILALRIRDHIAGKIDRSYLTEDSRTLLKALVLADRSGMSRRSQDIYREAGVAHVLAVSGLHAGIVCGAILYLTLPLVLIGKRRLRYLLVIAVMWGFTFITGMNYSTVRAALMITLCAIAWIYVRQKDPFAVVCLAAALILLFSPRALWDVGFQLSFTCVAALAIFAQPLNPIRKREHPKIYRICESLLVTLIATAAVAPLTIYYFGSHPTSFLITNIVLLPILPLYMAIGMIYVGILLCGYEIQILTDLLDLITRFFITFTSLFEGKAIPVSISLGGLCICMSLIILAAILIRCRHTSGRHLPPPTPIP